MEPGLKEIQKEWHGSKRSYLMGICSCLVLTLISFALVLIRPFNYFYMMIVLGGLALIQAACQLRFFLHVGQEAKPRWETLTFWFMLILLLTVVLGSFWIMFDLNSRVMGGM